jgi:restriction endonuclease S subunit
MKEFSHRPPAYITIMSSFIRDIAALQFGLYKKPSEKGAVRYFQAKDFDNSGTWNGKTDTWLNPTENTQKHILEDGDILFAGKGFRNSAWAYTEDIGPSIASSMFFVIRPVRQKVLPEYLSTVLNSEKYQSFFQTLSMGSSIPSIRKNELEAVEIPLPSLEDQSKIVEISRIHYQSVVLTNQILCKKNKLYQTVINQFINS